MLQSRNTTGPVILSNKPPMYTFPLGIAYVAGYLKQHRENVILDFWPTDEKDYASFVNKLISRKPLVVGFGGLYPDLFIVKELVSLLNQAGRDFPIVIGGQMVTPTAEFAVCVTQADYGVIGEGEIIFHNLVNALREGKDTTAIKGLVIREAGQVISTGPGPFIEDLSKIPPLPFDLMKSDQWLYPGRFYISYGQPQWKYSDRIVPIHGGRGCPFKCNFCYHHSKARYRPMHQIKSDILQMVDKYNPTLIDFSDDTVISTPKRAIELIETFGGLKKPVEYYLSCRFDTLDRLDDEVLREMKRTGCRTMGPGLESGSQQVLDTIGKGITIEQIRTGLRRLKDAGIMTTTAIQIGQLNETVEDAQKSIQLMVDSIRYDKHIAYAFSITTPFPGSELYDIAFQKGLLKSHQDFFNMFDPKQAMRSVTVNMSAMSDAELMALREEMFQIYWKEKCLTMSRGAYFVNICRQRLESIDNIIDARLWNRYRNRVSAAFAKRVYKILYHFVQNMMDIIWRRLWKVG